MNWFFTIYIVYTVYTIQTVLHCLDSGINSGMFLYNKQCSVQIYIVREGQNAIGMGS